MSLYLNKRNELFEMQLNSKIYVDKTLLIKETNKVLGKHEPCICVTRPRRFGKSCALAMLNAYYSKGCDSTKLFENFNISKDHSYLTNLNKHNVIWIDMTGVYCNVDDKSTCIDRLKRNILRDLKEAYPEINFKYNKIDYAIEEIHEKTNDTFIFLIDEYDLIFREEPYNTKLCKEYFDFLCYLFKCNNATPYIDLVYMTGILPIPKGGIGIHLDIFRESSMLDSRGLSEFIGFTDEEVKELCSKYSRDYNKIKDMYCGYNLDGQILYNPWSITHAIENNRIDCYWNQTASRESLTYYLNYENGIFKEATLKLINGDKVQFNSRIFSNWLNKVDHEDSALTVLVHYGYLAFESGEYFREDLCYIPNKEIRYDYINGVEDLNWYDIYNSINK